MDFDLISAYSVRVFWKADFHANLVQCESQPQSPPQQVAQAISNLNNDNDGGCDCDGSRPIQKIAAKCENGEGAVVVVNLIPSTTYLVQVFGDKNEEVLSNTFKTNDATTPDFHNLYQGIRMADGVYDTTRFEKPLHDLFMANFSNIVNSGDRILAKVAVNGVSQNVETVAVREGCSMKIDDDEITTTTTATTTTDSTATTTTTTTTKKSIPNVLLPFSSDNHRLLQTVSLQYANFNATLDYDAVENLFGYGGSMYGVGDRFEMFGQTVTVGDGSIVLLFSDTVAKTWPFDPSKALSVVGSAGSHFMKNVTANVSNLVGQKQDGETGSTYNSTWIHNTTDSSTTEISRTVHTIDEDSENATMSIGVLHTDASQNQFLEPTLQMKYDATTISTQDNNDLTTSATFQSSGLSFDNDDASIYFGADKNFRIKFSSGTPSVLQIQSYDAALEAYVTRQEVTDAS